MSGFVKTLRMYGGAVYVGPVNVDLPNRGTITTGSQNSNCLLYAPPENYQFRSDTEANEYNIVYAGAAGFLWSPSTWTGRAPCCLFAVPIYDDDENILGYAGCWLTHTSAFNITCGLSRTADSYTAFPTYYNTSTYSGNWPNTNWGGPCTYAFLLNYDEDRNYIWITPVGWSDRYQQGDREVSSYNMTSGTTIFGINLTKASNLLGGHVISELVSDAYGEASGEGGYTGGTFDDSSDTIGLPNAPAIGVSTAGFINVYNPTTGSLQGLGAELFPDEIFTPISGSASIQEAIEAAANTVNNVITMYTNSRLIDYIIDCHVIPVSPGAGTPEPIKIGFKTFSQSAGRCSSDYVTFDCGSLNVGEYYANFADYAPYTSAKLYLPFIGFVDIEPEFWQSGTLSVQYRFNIIDGSFMAFVLSSSSKSKLRNTVIASYGGNACVHLPITGLNYASMVSGVIGAAGGAMRAAASGNLLGAANSALAAAQSKPTMESSNAYNSTAAFLGVRKPYLLIERSVSNFSASYTDEIGVPSNISTDFSQLTGFTVAGNVHIDNINATETELQLIQNALAKGVIL